MKKAAILFIFLSCSFSVYGEIQTEISGYIDWETMRINAEVSVDLVSAGLKLPAGRTQAESLLNEGYLNLIRSHLLSMQVDSSSTIGDLIERGEFSLSQADTAALGSSKVPPAMKPDMRRMAASHTIDLSNISSALLRHNRSSPIIRTLTPVSAARYTGIIIIAVENQPVYGMRGTALPVPCLFPKIWDSEMNLIYERSTLEVRNVTMAHYSKAQNIFQNNPSGLTPELQQITGDRPLKIFARGVFGINPTDLIIDRSDALIIISSEENRNLLSQGKVVIILDDSVLKYKF